MKILTFLLCLCLSSCTSTDTTDNPLPPQNDSGPDVVDSTTSDSLITETGIEDVSAADQLSEDVTQADTHVAQTCCWTTDTDAGTLCACGPLSEQYETCDDQLLVIQPSQADHTVYSCE